MLLQYDYLTNKIKFKIFITLSFTAYQFAYIHESGTFSGERVRW